MRNTRSWLTRTSTSTSLAHPWLLNSARISSRLAGSSTHVQDRLVLTSSGLASLRRLQLVCHIWYIRSNTGFDITMIYADDVHHFGLECHLLQHQFSLSKDTSPGGQRHFRRASGGVLWSSRRYHQKASPSLWQAHLTRVLEDVGCTQSRADRCLFTSKDICLLIYMDNVMIVGTSATTSDFLQKLSHQFSLKHTTQLTTSQDVRFLGKRLRLDQDGSISISFETSYYIHMLKPYNLRNNNNNKPVSTTAKLQQPLDNSAPLDAEAHHQLGATVGQLVWASLERPDLTYAAKPHSSKAQHPITSDAASLNSLKHMLRYIKATMDYRLTLGRNIQQHLKQWSGRPIPTHVHGYTDSDWAGDMVTRKSTSGFIISARRVSQLCI